MKKALFNDGWLVSEKKGNFGVPVPTQAREVTLPYDAMIHTPRTPESTSSNKKGFYENGTWEYKKTFYVPAEDKCKKAVFQFDGIYQRAMVYINGSYAGQRPYGYSTFHIEADRFLKYGEDNEINVIARTADDSRWYTGAGIYRDVYLLTSNLVHIEPYGVKITTEQADESTATMFVETTIANESAVATVTVTLETHITDANGRVVATDKIPVTIYRGEKTTAQQRLSVRSPQLWNTDTPALYTCKTVVVDAAGSQLDEDEQSFGIRTLSLDKFNGLRINGVPTKLRGACIHHDNGPLGAVSTYGIELRRMQKLKEAGFNAIRMSHHPAAPALLRACDEIGLLVMDETFDMWTEAKSNHDYALDFETWWERDVEAMVAKDYNHPSVILYSIGNEIQDTGSPTGTMWGRKIAQKIRALDATRFTVNSINGMVSVMELLHSLGEQSEEQQEPAAKDEINNMMAGMGEMMKQVMQMPAITEATAEAFACVDIAGYNYMDSRYDMDRELFPNRIVLGSETYPPDIDRNWRMVLDNPNNLGDFTWTGWDYIGEAGIGKVNYPEAGKLDNVYMGYPTLPSMTADTSISGFRRPISYWREIVFGQRTAPYIAVHRPEHYGKISAATPWSWSDSVSSWSWDGFEGKPVRVEVYAPSEEVELFLNGKSISKAPAGEENRFKALFDTVFEPGELVAVAYSGGKECGRTTLHSTAGDLQLAVTPEKKVLPLAAQEFGYIPVSIQDANGNVAVVHNCKVKVSVEGAGILAALGNDDPDIDGNFYDHECMTYDGRALAIVRPTDKGIIRITVSADGLTAKTVEIEAQ